MKSQPSKGPGHEPTCGAWLSFIVYRRNRTAAMDPGASDGLLKCPRSAGVNVPLAAGRHVVPSVEVSSENGPAEALPASPHVPVGSIATSETSTVAGSWTTTNFGTI